MRLPCVDHSEAGINLLVPARSCHRFLEDHSVHVADEAKGGICVKPVTPASLGDRKPSLKKGRLERLNGVQVAGFTQTIPLCMTPKDFPFGFVRLRSAGALG